MKKSCLLLIVLVAMTAVNAQVKKTIDSLQGKWVNEKDKRAKLLISGNHIDFYYEGVSGTPPSIYEIHFCDSLPQFAQVKGHNQFMVLSQIQKLDTMYYEIMGLSKNTLSLLHYPTGHLHVYHKNPKKAPKY